MASESAISKSLNFSVETFVSKFRRDRKDQFGPEALLGLLNDSEVETGSILAILQGLRNQGKLTINEPLFGNGFTLLEYLVHSHSVKHYYIHKLDHKRAHEIFDILIELGAKPNRRYRQLYSAYEMIQLSRSEALENLIAHVVQTDPEKKAKETYKAKYYEHMYAKLRPSGFSCLIGTFIGVLLGPIINTFTTAVFNLSLFLNLLTGKVNARVHLMANPINNKVFALFGLFILLPLSILIAPIVGAFKGQGQGFDYGFLASIKPNQYYATSAQSFANIFLRGAQTSNTGVALRFPRLGHVLLGLFILTAMVAGIATSFGLPLAAMVAGLVGLTGLGAYALAGIATGAILVAGMLVSAVVGAFAKHVSSRADKHEPYQQMREEVEMGDQMGDIRRAEATTEDEDYGSGKTFQTGREDTGDKTDASVEPSGRPG